MERCTPKNGSGTVAEPERSKKRKSGSTDTIRSNKAYGTVRKAVFAYAKVYCKEFREVGSTIATKGSGGQYNPTVCQCYLYEVKPLISLT